MIMRIPNICRFAEAAKAAEQIVYHDKRKECTRKKICGNDVSHGANRIS